MDLRHLLLLLLLHGSLGKRREKYQENMRDKESGLNLCDIQEAGVNMYCYCDQQAVNNASDAACWIYHGETVNALDADVIGNYFSSQRNLVKMKFNVRPDAKLRVLPTRSLSKLTRLQAVEVKYAAIAEVPKRAFFNLSALQEVLLSRNQIVALQNHAFSHLPSLQVIGLEENRLTEIQRDVFSALPALKQLFLDRNNISVVQDRAFSHLHALEELDLHGNQLSTITAETFTGLHSLRRLDLHQNRLSVLPDAAFSALRSLRELAIYDNELRVLGAAAFSGLYALRTLRMADNKLAELPDAALRAMTDLRTLDLRGNSLRSLSYEAVAPLAESLKNASADIFLAGNSFACDCRLSWMFLLRNETPSSSVRSALDEVTCVLDPDAVLDPADDDPGYDDDVDEATSQTSVPTGAVRHLFDIALEQLPCPEESPPPRQLDAVDAVLEIEAGMTEASAASRVHAAWIGITTLCLVLAQ